MANQEIFICGWWVRPEIELIREDDERVSIGELLIQKPGSSFF